MPCFTDFILVRGACGTATPSSGLFLNDLPGITLRNLANVANEEQVTGIGLANNAIALGIDLTKKEIMERMLDIVRFNSVYSSKRIGNLNYDLFAGPTAGFNGITSELDCDCKLLRQCVSRIDILLNTTLTDAVLRIVDGPTTTNFTFSTVAGGITTIYPNYEAVNETIEISYDTSAVSYSSSGFSGQCFCNTCNTSCNQCICDCNIIVRSTAATTFGLRPNINVICSADAFFCDIMKFMGRPAWYRSGILFIDELLMTSRLNEFTLYDIDRAQAIQEKWMEEYEACITDLVNRLPKYFDQVDACCVECNSSHWTQAHP